MVSAPPLMARKLAEALTRELGITKSAAAAMAQIFGAAAAVVVDLSPAQRQRLKSKSADLADIITMWARADERIEIPTPTEVEVSKGSGFGELIDIEEGRRRLRALVVDVPLEEWAGSVAGSSRLMRDFGIARSTLHDWQKRGEVISLLKGSRKHAFPLEQFVDGRPAQGIGEVLKIVGNPRRAWFWLVQRSPLLGNKKPIDLLKQDRTGEVLEAARIVFEYP
jgi:hypothetical protein